MASSSTRALSSAVRCCHLLLQPLSPTRIFQSHRGLAGQHAQHIAVRLTQAAKAGVHISIEIAYDFILGDERGGDTRDSAGISGFGRFKLHRACAPGLFQALAN